MARARDAVADALSTALTPLLVRSVVATLPATADQEIESLDVVEGYDLLRHTASAARIFSPDSPPDLLEVLHQRVTAGRSFRPTSRVLPVTSDADVIAAQEAALQMLRGLFRSTDCVRVATAVSELVRNIYAYARTGEVRLELSEADRMLTFRVVASDRGPGIARLEEVLAGTYRSMTGLGRGLAGAKALLDELNIQTGPQGTTVTGLKKASLADLGKIS
jgi:serine/threonine-protein kinase RsbT